MQAELAQRPPPLRARWAGPGAAEAGQEEAGLRVGLGETVGPGETGLLRRQLPGARRRGSGPQKSRASAPAT